MSEEQLEELQEYNLEYLEAQQSEEIFGGNYTSAIELKYAKKEIERLNNKLQDFKVQDISNQEQLYNLIEENERLNNIINELKEWFKGYHKSYASCKWYEGDYIEFIEHLENELKGSDKE